MTYTNIISLTNRCRIDPYTYKLSNFKIFVSRSCVRVHIYFSYLTVIEFMKRNISSERVYFKKVVSRNTVLKNKQREFYLSCIYEQDFYQYHCFFSLYLESTKCRE